jgi:hypothetical protein
MCDLKFNDADIMNRKWLRNAILMNIIVTQVGNSQSRFIIEGLENMQLF